MRYKQINKELLFSVTKKDLDISYFSGSGAGGQHRNAHKNCVRMYHKESDVRTTGQDSRERKSNLKTAFNRLVEHPKFKIWLNQKTYEKINKVNIEKLVKDEMSSDNLLIEGKSEEGDWVKIV